MANKRGRGTQSVFAAANVPVHLSLHSYLRGWQLCFNEIHTMHVKIARDFEISGFRDFGIDLKILVKI